VLSMIISVALRFSCCIVVETYQSTMHAHRPRDCFVSFHEGMPSLWLIVFLSHYYLLVKDMGHASSLFVRVSASVRTRTPYLGHLLAWLCCWMDRGENLLFLMPACPLWSKVSSNIDEIEWAHGL